MKHRQTVVSLPTHVLMAEVEQLIGQGRTVTLPVRGNSMLPLIRNGDCVVLAPVDAAVLRQGAVVLAWTTNEQVVLHRIVSTGHPLTLQGDGNIGQTEQTTPDRVIAVVTHAVRSGRSYACSGTQWRAASALWRVLKPFRRVLLAVMRRI